MTQEISLDQEAFFQKLLNRFQLLSLDDPLARSRARSWEHFLKLGVPTKKSEVFQYLKLRHLYEKEFSDQKVNIDPDQIKSHYLKGSEGSVAVFINGQFSPTHSNFKNLPAKTIAISSNEAVRSFGSLVNNQSNRWLQEEKDPLATLNSALSEKGLFVYFPPKAKLEPSFHILQIMTGNQAFSNPKVELFFGALSETEVVSTVVYLNSEKSLNNLAVHFSLEEGAKVKCNRSYLNTPSSSWQFDAVRANLKRDSSFHSVIVQDGMETFRDDYRVRLLESNAEVFLSGIALLKEKRESHTHVLIEHIAPECQSLQLFKSVVNDSARSSFEGKIYVFSEAQKTQAFQLNNNLLLSDGAQAFSKPNLEIFADDVKASHGATVGQLDKEHLFYMMARGLSKERAQTLLVQGFCLDVIDKIDSIPLRELAMKYASGYLK